jgi:protein SCO1/2
MTFSFSRCTLQSLAAFSALIAVAAGGPVPAAVAGEHDHHMHQQQAPANRPVSRITANYTIPDAPLVRMDGTKVNFGADIDDGKPVVLNFIYTTCTAICPVMTQTFAEVQGKLGSDRDQVRMVSVSIDPEQDTPARLREYAKQYRAGPQWQFYTGTVQSSIAVQRAFDAYRGDKMNHTPVTFLRAAPGKPWIRIDGFATPDEIVREVRQLVAAR